MAEAAAQPVAEEPASLIADAPAADAATPVATAAPAKTDDSTPAEKPAGEEAKANPKPEAKAEGEGEASLLAEDDEGKAKEKADGPADAKPEAAPETYAAFTLPDGMTLDAETLAKATPILMEVVGPDQDKAQKLVSFYAEQMKAAGEANSAQAIAQHNALKSEWAAKTKADPEFAGDKFPQAKAAAITAINKLARTPQEAIEVKNILSETGFANHPAVFALLVRAGSKLSEDTLVRTDAADQIAQPKKPWELLYPDMASKG